tara:strand:+ start:19500 stop:19850 length:351 start_codon:yes stop_codon:yes gene_type:complete
MIKRYDVSVMCSDSIDLMKKVLALSEYSPSLREKTRPRLTQLPLQVSLVIYTEKDIESFFEGKHGYNVKNLGYVRQYTKEQLEAMEWEDFKTLCKDCGVGGRDRNTMTNKYLSLTD